MSIEKKIIPAYEDYVAYADGRVYSNKSNKFLKPVILNRGYKGIVLYNSNGRKMISRHRLICSVFNPVPNMRDLTVDHINGIPGCDNAANLEFVTIKENIRRFYRARGKRKASPCVIVQFLNTNTTVKYKNTVVCGIALNLHKDTVLARLHQRFGKIFPDMTLIKYANDDREFPKYTNIKYLQNLCSNKKSILVKDIWTDDIFEYDTMLKACLRLGIKLPAFSIRLNSGTDYIYNNKYAVRINHDLRPWRKYATLKDKIQHINSFSSVQRGVLVVIGEDKHVFFTSIDASAYLGITPVALYYRMQQPGKHNYFYIDEYEDKLNQNEVTIHFNNK